MSQKSNQGVILRIRKSRTFRGLTICLALNLFFEMVHPTVSLALTEGPSQPEVQSFEPVGTTQMVDLFSGDFNYNIPLFNLPGPNGGYPVNLAYHAGVTMDDEASWVGLGWNLNVGSLVRNMRGLPDEFKSEANLLGLAEEDYDHLEVKSDMKPSWSLAASFTGQSEVIGSNLLNPGFSLGTSVYYNNYRGMGVSISPSFGFGDNNAFSLGLSLDSENGLGVNTRIGYSAEDDMIRMQYSLGLNFDGDLSVSYGLQGSQWIASMAADRSSIYSRSAGSSSSLSFNTSSFSPNVARNVDRFNAAINIGGLTSQLLPFMQNGFSLGFSYSSEVPSLIDIQGRRVPVVGHDELGNISGSDLNKFTRDFTRQNDASVTKESVMLANSYGTYDTYNSTGQGLSGFFRPHRRDIGRFFDPEVYDFNGGGSVGFDVGAGQSFQTSGQVNVNGGWTKEGAWNTYNDLNDDFLVTNPYGEEENLYYKVHGESTVKLSGDLSYLGGTVLAKVNLKSNLLDLTKPSIDNNVTFNNSGSDLSVRSVRNTLVHTFKNNEVEHLGEFNFNYYDNPSSNDLFSDPQNAFSRDKRYDRDNDGNDDVHIGNHKAGFKVLNDQGSYYVYGLPAYNLKEVNNIFSVPVDPNHNEDTEITSIISQGGVIDYKQNGTHKYNSRTTTSPYAHSYLLTSVLGADYVDRTNDGPSNDDLGYWVKFDYAKESDSYWWRAPYSSAHAQFHRGAGYHKDDDKGSYSYGEKELWYLARIETKSHIAIFITSPRHDYEEAEGENLGGLSSDGEHGVKLDRIEVYEKSGFGPGATPLQTVHFTYSDAGTEELCKDVPNANNNRGKLTLESVHFTSLGSSRGERSKYKFDYAGLDLTGTGIDSQEEINPTYRMNSYDSWGNYRDIVSGANTDYDFYSNFAYTNQFNQEWDDGFGYNTSSDADETQQTKDKTKRIVDRNASAWCLNRIELPSGGVINIDYESDDYGYVQHKTAAQMFRIVRMGEGFQYVMYDKDEDENFSDPNATTDEDKRRIYFKLENPIKQTVGQTGLDLAEEVYSQYVDPLIEDEKGDKNLYFKCKMNISTNVWDYVSGYLPLEKNLSNGTNHYNYGVLESDPQLQTTFTDGGETFYRIGFVTIQPAKKKNGSDFTKYHPMSLAAWTYLQTNAQELLYNPNSFSSASPNGNNLGGFLVDLVNFVPQLMSSFGAIRNYCKNRGFGDRVMGFNGKSAIRLASPDKIKFGGGHRVKKISISDEWASSFTSGNETSRTYGQVFDYTINENGKDISSGVATYEPRASGDDNALKYPIFFYGKSSIFTRNNLFSEAPANEDIFPAPSVGYRKVTVRSLNTDDQQKAYEAVADDYGRTGGITVHEYYTAKDFPTMVSYTRLSEQDDTKKTFNVPIPIPLIGSIKRNYFHATQAYLIETNDMHGRPKAVRTYELNNYVVNPNPITEDEMIYQADATVYQGEYVFRLNNQVSVINSTSDDLQPETGTSRLLGVEVDMYTDQREAKTSNTQAGVDLGFELPSTFPIFPGLEFWPTYSNHKTLFRTFVTNKIIHRSGILKKTKSRDLQSSTESEVLAYDERSGNAIKVKTTNQFGDEIYAYSIPAYYKYDRMGHAYQNIDYNAWLSVTNLTSNADGTYLRFAPAGGPSNSILDHLVRGDEVIVTGAWKGRRGPLDDGGGNYVSASDQGHKKGYYLGTETSTVSGTVGIIHFPDDLTSSDFGTDWSNGGGTVSTDITSFYPEIRVIRSGRRNHYATMAGAYSMKGEVATTGTEQLTASVVVDVIGDNVLSASASLYKDDWGTSASLDATFDGTSPNPFLTGNSGIWRPYKSYSYVGERSGAANLDANLSGDPDLRSDGVMSNVPMFTWDLGNIETYSAMSDWEWVNEVTRFSEDAYELENVNRLGIYSSALYGYDNSLSIAVGGNAGIHELGTYDFEMSGSSTQHKLLAQTNMNFEATSGGSSIITEQVNVVSATMGPNNELEVVLDIPFAQGFSLAGYDATIGISLNSEAGGTVAANEGFYFNGTHNATVTNNGGNAAFKLTPYIDNPSQGPNMLPDGTTTYTGKVTLLKFRNYSANTGGFSVSTEKAHTGKKSLKVTSAANFDQPNLTMEANKKYILSMWVSKEQDDVATYEPGEQGNSGLSIISVSAASGTVNVGQAKFGKIIEGWQKVDFELSATSNDAVLKMTISPAMGNAIYIDDIRFSPKTGGITTYVYDPVKFWVRASLNVDNYATFFYYDEEGNLTIKKQETEEGIFTITEARAHTNESNQ